MSKRSIVYINYEKVVLLIKEHYRNNTIFCEAINSTMGTNRTTKWVSEWKRNSNLPSPKEAAVMCILLETTPEEILLHEGKTDGETAKCLEDIQRVKELVAELRKEEAVPTTTGLPITRKAWEAEAEKWSDEDLIKAMRKLLAIQEERREKNGD